MGITPDWANFTPWTSLAGGALIGLAAVLLMALAGRIMGISGILGGLLQWRNTPPDHFLWRASFLAGLFLSATVWALFRPVPQAEISASTPLLVLAGLLVGIGTRMGSGCTSGHAVCGLARLSPRSLVATAAFMASGFLTAFLFLHL
jgi:uncharacterized membrane protein YedE/YeeE